MRALPLLAALVALLLALSASASSANQQQQGESELHDKQTESPAVATSPPGQHAAVVDHDDASSASAPHSSAAVTPETDGGDNVVRSSPAPIPADVFKDIPSHLDLLHEHAEAPFYNPEAMFILGNFYMGNFRTKPEKTPRPYLSLLEKWFFLKEASQPMDSPELDYLNFTAAFEQFSNLAWHHGNSTAQGFLGLMYSTGMGVPRDQAKALVHLFFGAYGGDLSSTLILGYRYLRGIGVEQNCDEAVARYEKVASIVAEQYEKGVKPSISKLRIDPESDKSLFLKGPNRRTSSLNSGQEDILQYYQHTADKGEPSAQLIVGTLYYQGTHNIPQNYILAHRYFSVAAGFPSTDPGPLKAGIANLRFPKEISLTNAQAMAHLGYMYLRGEGVAVNKELAWKLFDLAASKDVPAGRNGLGIMWRDGITVPKNLQKAEELFAQASEANYADAFYNLAMLKIERFGELAHATAQSLLARASQQGHVLAIYQLGVMNLNGMGSPASCSMAVKLFKNVAERGEWTSIVARAHSDFEAGDFKSAIIKYMIASEQGYEIAESNLAVLLENTEEKDNFINGEDNQVLAMLYWNRAANQGNVEARVRLGDFHWYGRGVNASAHQAASYYLAADGEQSAQASFNLGYMHEHGIGLKQDFHLAKRFYDRAQFISADSYLAVNMALTELAVRYASHLVWEHGVWEGLQMWWSRWNRKEPEPTPKKVDDLPFTENAGDNEQGNSEQEMMTMAKIIDEILDEWDSYFIVILFSIVLILIYIRHFRFR